jgi:hypothetical protein
MNAPNVDHNTNNWSGFFASEELAKVHLEEQTKKLGKDKLVLSSKMQFVDKKCHDLLLYKFHVVVSAKI